MERERENNMKSQKVAGFAALAATVLLGSFAFAQHGKMQGHQMQGGMMMQTAASKKVMQQVNGIKSAKNYNCCIKPKCDWCAVHMGSCPCGMAAATGKPVCTNCKGGWEAGMGAISGKTAADIKVMKMEDMQKMKGGKM